MLSNKISNMTCCDVLTDSQGGQKKVAIVFVLDFSSFKKWKNKH